MQNNLDLDIDKYNDYDLLNLFNSSHKDNNNQLFQKYNQKIKSLNNIPNNDMKLQLTDFFNKAFTKLSRFLKKNTQEEKKNRVFKKVPVVFENVNSSLEETKNMHPSPDVRENNIQSNVIIKYPKGTLNPIEKKITSEVLCIDTTFRDKIKYPNSTDFVYQLPNPIENVISMKLINAEIPKNSKVFSKDKNNNLLKITMYNGFEYINNSIVVWDKPKTLDITIPEGSPTFSEIVSTIQSSLDVQRNSFSFLKFDIDRSSNGKFFFRFKTLIECVNWSLNFYQNDQNEIVTPPDNKLPTFNFRMPVVNDVLGTGEYDELEYIYKGRIWSEENNSSVIDLLKLTKTEYLTFKNIPDPSKTVISHDLYNTYPSNYYPLKYSIDFNPTNCVIENSLGWILGFRQYINESSFASDKIDHTNCFCRDEINFLGYTEAIAPYGDSENTYNYLYVDDFVGNYKDSLNVVVNNSYLTKSLLAKIQMDTSFYNVQYVNSSSETSILEKKREYFGPVNIKKLHFKIIDKFNNVVDFEKSNFSLTLQFEKLYNNIRN